MNKQAMNALKQRKDVDASTASFKEELSTLRDNSNVNQVKFGGQEEAPSIIEENDYFTLPSPNKKQHEPVIWGNQSASKVDTARNISSYRSMDKVNKLDEPRVETGI